MKELIKKIISETTDIPRSLTLLNIEEKPSCTLIEVSGGENGRGLLSSYLEQAHDLVSSLEQTFKDVWLVNWENDTLDDVWYLTIAVK